MRSLLFCTGWAEPCRNHGASHGPVALTAKHTKAGETTHAVRLAGGRAAPGGLVAMGVAGLGLGMALV